MLKQTKSVWILLIVVTALVAGVVAPTKVHAAAGINQQMAFQGKVILANGTNVANGTYNVEFKIYNGGTATGGGTQQWSEDYLIGGTGGVTITNGVFSVNLGAANAFASNVNWNSDTLWLSLQVGNTSSCTLTTTFQSNCGGDGEMTPYIRLTAVPYAFNALQLGGVAASGYAQLAGTNVWSSANTFNGALNANSGLGIAGLETQSYGSATNASASTKTVTNTNTSATVNTVNGLNIALVGTANANAGGNSLNGITFPNVAAATNNSFTGLNFGTGYNSLLTYNGTSIINGSGVLQTAGLSGTYSGALNLSNVGNTYFGSGANLTSLSGTSVTTGTVAAANGGTGLNASAAANGNLLIGNGSGFSLTGLTNNGGLTITTGAGSIGLAVAYGSVANTAAQGNTSLTFTGSGNLTGSISGTAGGGFTTNTLALVNNPTFSGLITGSASTGGLILSGTPAAVATASLAQFSTAIAGGNTAANGGTYLGINLPSSGAGSAADFLNFQSAGAARLNVTSAGVVNASGAINGASVVATSTVTANTSLNTGTGAGTARVDVSGNLVNIGNFTSTAGSTFITTGATGFTFKPGTNNATAFAIQNAAASTTIFNIDTSGLIVTVGGTSTTFGSLTIANAHIKSTQTTAPTIGTPATCGTGPTAAVTASSTDTAGSFTITSGTGSTGICSTIVTFANAYGAAPKAIIVTTTTAVGTATGLLEGDITATSTTSFTIRLNTSGTVSTKYSFYYMVIE